MAVSLCYFCEGWGGLGKVKEGGRGVKEWGAVADGGGMALV